MATDTEELDEVMTIEGVDAFMDRFYKDLKENPYVKESEPVSEEPEIIEDISDEKTEEVANEPALHPIGEVHNILGAEDSNIPADELVENKILESAAPSEVYENKNEEDLAKTTSVKVEDILAGMNVPQNNQVTEEQIQSVPFIPIPEANIIETNFNENVIEIQPLPNKEPEPYTPDEAAIETVSTSQQQVEQVKEEVNANEVQNVSEEADYTLRFNPQQAMMERIREQETEVKEASVQKEATGPILTKARKEPSGFIEPLILMLITEFFGLLFIGVIVSQM